MNKREYLRSLGFTVGERGRFSAEMIAAIESAPEGAIVEPVVEPKTPRVAKPKVAMVDSVPAPAEAKAFPKLPNLPIVRPEKVLYALTPIGQTHAVVGYSTCQRCHYQVQNCACQKGPKPPAGAIPVVGKPVA